MRISKRYVSLTLNLLIGVGLCFAQRTSGHITVNGTQFDYVIEGKGIPTLVLGSSIYYPRTFSNELRSKFQMHFVDLHWFAADYDPSRLKELTIETIVEDIQAIKEALKLDDPLIIGHSIHGTISMEYAKRHSSQIRGVVVIGSPCAWGNDTYDTKAAALWETASPQRKRLQEENWGELSEIDRLTGQEEASARYNNMSPQYWYDPTYDAAWLWEEMTVHTAVTTHLFTKVFDDYEMFPTDTTIAVPVLLVLGKHDYVIPYTLWANSYPQVPDFTHRLFDKSGHTPQLEQAELFNETLLAWAQEKLNNP